MNAEFQINEIKFTKKALDKLLEACEKEEEKPFAIRIGVKGGRLFRFSIFIRFY